ncbi:MAG: glycosyltransferase family 2 protein [Planctomycetes bacterium]|nr:glycosyltransferase family 2 protein [Planctomycetota bacterium]
MTVTVVIPAYNNSEHIARALDSVCSQSLTPHQVIVVDDGSTDDTAEIVKKYDNVEYIYQQNAGASAGRNTGIENATGEWIAFLDADDEWLAEYLEKQTALLKANGDLQWAGANYHRCHCNDKKQEVAESSQTALECLNGKDYFDSYFTAYLNKTRGWTGTLIIKKSVFETAGLFNTEQLRFNDEDMWWRIAFTNIPFGYNPEPLAIYHMHISNSITKRYKASELFSEFMARHLRYAEQAGCYDLFEPCAKHMLKYWIHRFWYDENAVYIRGLVDRFDNILDNNYKRLVRFLTIYPKLTSAMMPLLSRINKIFGLKL